MDHTVHAADAIRWLIGDEFSRVQAEFGSFIYGLDVEDCGVMTCDLRGGAFASIDCSWSRPQTFPTWGGVTLHVVVRRGPSTSTYSGRRSPTMTTRPAALGSSAGVTISPRRMVAGFVRCHPRETSSTDQR
jgi:predicted dehydrogenase